MLMTPVLTLRRSRAAGGLLALSLGLLAAVLLAVAGGRPAQAGVGNLIEVDPGESIQAAINGASPFDTVQVNPGTYTESLTLSKTVNLVGLNAATTIIQAQPGQRVITVTGSLVNAAVLIENLTFQGGVISGSTVCPQSCGGGMLILTGTTAPRLQNLVFRNNAAYLGGGLFAGASLTVTGALFTNNTATLEGGGLHLANSYPITPEYTLRLSNTQFISNTSAGYGAGAFVFGTALIADSRFERNTCKLTGPEPCYGGGLVSRYLEMTNTDFYTNVARYGGGGAYTSILAQITGGVFQANSTYGFGGGLLARTLVVVTGTQFISNTAETGGGGLYTYLGNPGGLNIVTGAYFERNSCTFTNCSGGGLMAVDVGATLAVIATDFVSNTSRGSGGGLYSGLPLTLTDALLQGNTCTGGACGGGGLIVANQINANDIVVRNNSAQFGGGGAYLLGISQLTDAVFQDNVCGASNCRGGGVHAVNNLYLTNAQFIHNTSDGAGGGVAQVSAGDLQIVNGLFARNVAGNGGGRGVWFFSPGSGLLRFTTFANPSVVTGSAVLIDLGSLVLTNTIIANYATGIQLNVGTASEDYTLFDGVASPRVGSITFGSHHPTGNPLFVNPATDNYHLSGNSPAIDVGLSVGIGFDVDGDVRPQQNGVDLGFDEFTLKRLYVPVVTK